MPSLVGSEMCIRDRGLRAGHDGDDGDRRAVARRGLELRAVGRLPGRIAGGVHADAAVGEETAAASDGPRAPRATGERSRRGWRGWDVSPHLLRPVSYTHLRAHE